jgi:hypothetical protein
MTTSATAAIASVQTAAGVVAHGPLSTRVLSRALHRWPSGLSGAQQRGVAVADLGDQHGGGGGVDECGSPVACVRRVLCDGGELPVVGAASNELDLTSGEEALVGQRQRSAGEDERSGETHDDHDPFVRRSRGDHGYDWLGLWGR